ncbi:MAG: FAD-dependent oxidoreductase, partial [Myxococcota bacterium]
MSTLTAPSPALHTYNVLISLQLPHVDLIRLLCALHHNVGRPPPPEPALIEMIRRGPVSALGQLRQVPRFGRRRLAHLRAALTVTDLTAVLAEHLQQITDNPPIDVPPVDVDAVAEDHHPFGPDAGFPADVADALERANYTVYGEPRAVPGFRFGARIVHFRQALRRPIPETALVVGAGYVGVEMAVHWGRSGAQVLLIDRLPYLLYSYDDQQVAPVRQMLADAGVQIRLETLARGWRQTPERIYVAGDGPQGPWMLGFELVLLAVG